MEIFVRGEDDNFKLSREEFCGVGLGMFDGLHIGHMSLLNTLVRESEIHGLKSLVYTFDKNPGNVVNKRFPKLILSTREKKINLLSETSLDMVYFENFDEKYSKISPESFIKEILVDKFNIKLAVAGYDYHFGYNGQGDIKLLAELGRLYKFRVVEIPPVKIGNNPVSSTKIRNLIKSGDMPRAFILLGRHYSITADVVEGRRVGSIMGFPTANILPDSSLVLPANGVYITKTKISGKYYSSTTNIGYIPTFETNNKLTVETHILDFNKNIYGETIEVFFLLKIRDEKKFANAMELAEQINTDKKAARDFFNH